MEWQCERCGIGLFRLRTTRNGNRWVLEDRMYKTTLPLFIYLGFEADHLNYHLNSKMLSLWNSQWKREVCKKGEIREARVRTEKNYTEERKLNLNRIQYSQELSEIFWQVNMYNEDLGRYCIICSRKTSWSHNDKEVVLDSFGRGQLEMGADGTVSGC